MSPKIVKITDRIVTCVVILAVAILISHIVVFGQEIDSVSEMTGSNCTVTITTYQHMQWDNAIEYELDSEEILELKQLILDSTFTKGLFIRDLVTFDDKDMYDIVMSFDNGKQVLIHSIGNEYINISGDDTRFLRIHNKNWKSVLNSLIVPEGGA